MTTLDALQSKVGVNYPSMNQAAQVALIDAGIDPNATYDQTLTQRVDICSAGLMLALATSPDIQEGGYIITQGDRKNLLEARRLILAKYGLSDGSDGFISDVSSSW